MQVPFSKPYLTLKEANAASEAVLSGWVTQGPRVKTFEEDFSRYVNSPYAAAVSSCTTALHLAFVVAGIGKGDEVICPSMTYIATANAIVHAGATPVFAEIDPDTFNLDPSHTKLLITKKTKAILLVHQLGLPADIDTFKRIAQENNLLLIEDAACAAGSFYKGQLIGNHSELVCFSFHPRKVITTGDGGMITTSNKEYYERIKILRQHGMSAAAHERHGKIVFEEHLEIGYNYRMTDIQAAVGIEQLKKLETVVKMRREAAHYYIEKLKTLEQIKIPVVPEYATTNYQSFAIILKDSCKLNRNDLIQKLFDKGVHTRRGVMLIHKEAAYKERCAKVSLPVSEKAYERSLLLPMFAGITREEIDYVVSVLEQELQ